jgi:probable HAF family extracellular repeat protein
MKSRFLILVAAMTLFAALAIPVQLAAQDSQDNHKHHHYQLIDMGTFGGPASFVPETIFLIAGNKGDLNSRGLVVGGSATSTSTTGTSNPNVCGELGGLPFVSHAFEWQNGTVTDLGSLGGADYCSVPGGINANGEIVGNSENGEVDPLTGLNKGRAVRWKDGEIKDLGTLGGYEGIAIGINDRGQVVGSATNAIPDPIGCLGPGAQCRAFLWQGGVMQDLGTLGGPDAFAILINERGQVAGASYTNSVPVTDPFLWENGKMTDLGTFGGTFGYPLALNNKGQVVGQSNLAGDLTAHPFLWPGKDGKMLDLGTLGGSYGTANAINEAGEIVGYASNAGDQDFLAFFWRNGVLTNLGTVGGDPCSTANAINSRRQVVGISFADCNAVRHAFLWENGSMVDLNTLIPPGPGVQLNLAEAINDRGEIAVNGDPPGCGVVEQCGHAYLLIPCDVHHPGVEGCDYRLADAILVPQVGRVSRDSLQRGAASIPAITNKSVSHSQLGNRPKELARQQENEEIQFVRMQSAIRKNWRT